MNGAVAPPFPSADELPEALGSSMYQLVRELYPIHRSITGEGVRSSLRRIGEIIDLETSEVPTGTRVFDWEVPREWNIRDAYIKDGTGRRIVDYRESNLHVLGYSSPVDQVLSLEELRPHLHSIPEHPDWIPFRASYYREDWGFCLAHRTLEKMREDQYEVRIDSTLEDGSLTYAEHVVRGASDDEIVLFAHTCHPSLCNDNLSGIALGVYLAEQLRLCRLRYTYRFIFAPSTIGSITWLARNEKRLSRIKGGLVLSVIGDRGHLVYKRSRQSTSEMDLAAEHVLSTYAAKHEIRDFVPWGYDERQFCSPGIDLAVGRLTRTPNGEYPEYHSSADDLDFVDPSRLLDSLRAVFRIVEVLEGNGCFRNTAPKGEPQLGRRGLYRSVGGSHGLPDREFALLWVLNQSDGDRSLLDIAMRSGLPFRTIRSAADELLEAGLLAQW